MIPDLIIGVVVGVLRGVIDLIPVWTPPEELSGSYATVLGDGLSWANGYFPVVTLLACLAILIATKAALLIPIVLAYVWDKIPLKAT